MRTYSAKPTDISRSWYLLDASKLPLGRLSTQAASLLLGKHKPLFTSHVDCGDFVVIVNASNIVVTGNKRQTKMYYHHSGHAGGLAARTLSEQLEKDPTKVVYTAIRNMLPANKLREGRLARLKIYSGSEHKHSAQQPKVITLGEEQ